MKVLVSTSTFPVPSQVGLPRFVDDLAQGIARYGEVTVLAPDAPAASRRERVGRVDVRRFTYFRPRRYQRLAYGHGMRANARSVLGALQVPLFIAAQARATARAVRERGIEVVNSHWLIPQGLATACVRRSRASFGHVLSVHAGDVSALRNLPMGRSIARFVLDRTDFVFVDGSSIRDDLDDLLGRPSGGVLQPMGAHVETFRSGESLTTAERPFPAGFLLFVGRLTEKKGLTHLLRAMPSVLRRHPELGLMAIGYGELADQLSEEASRLGIGASVRFLGRQPHGEIGRYLRGCRAAVVPSVVDRNGETDGMPTVVVEAMAAGTRVVGSAVDGIPDVLSHRDNGWLCRQKDPEDLAEKILEALEDPSSSRVVERASETAAELDWTRVAERYASVLRRLVEGDQGV